MSKNAQYLHEAIVDFFEFDPNNREEVEANILKFADEIMQYPLEYAGSGDAHLDAQLDMLRGKYKITVARRARKSLRTFVRFAARFAAGAIA